MRGHWQGSGTFQTTGGGGIFAVLASLAAVAGIIYAAGAVLGWLASRIWWIAGAGIAVLIGIAAALYILARLMRRGRAADLAEIAQRWHAVQASARPRAAQETQPAVEQHVHYHHYHYHAAGEQVPAVIRTALPGRPGTPSPKGNNHGTVQQPQ